MPELRTPPPGASDTIPADPLTTRLRVAATVFAVLAAGWAVARWFGWLLVLAGRPIPDWVVLTFLLAGWRICSRVVARRAPQPDGRLRFLRKPAATIALCALVFYGVIAMVTGVRYLELTPSSPAGCRVFVIEHSLILSNGGTVHTLSGNWGVATAVTTFRADGSFRDKRFYELTWDSSPATLTYSMGPTIALPC